MIFREETTPNSVSDSNTELSCVVSPSVPVPIPFSGNDVAPIPLGATPEYNPVSTQSYNEIFTLELSVLVHGARPGHAGANAGVRNGRR